MTIAITIKRADNNPTHDAEVRVYDLPANSTGHEKTLALSYPLPPDGSVTVNIWSTRAIEVHEVAKGAEITEPVSKRGVYRFGDYAGRGYDVEGTFVATAEQVAKVMGKRVYFGEICGKHSEVTCKPTPETLKLLTDDPAVVEAFEKFNLGSGHNPVDQFENYGEEE